MHVSVHVNEPFMIKCCTTTQKKALLYIILLTSDDKYTVCGTNFLPNQLLCQKYLATFLLYGADFRSRAGQRKRSSFTDFAGIGRTLETYGHPCTMILKVYINGRENGRKPRKATQQRVNEFFTNLPPKT